MLGNICQKVCNAFSLCQSRFPIKLQLGINCSGLHIHNQLVGSITVKIRIRISKLDNDIVGVHAGYNGKFGSCIYHRLLAIRIQFIIQFCFRQLLHSIYDDLLTFCRCGVQLRSGIYSSERKRLQSKGCIDGVNFVSRQFPHKDISGVQRSSSKSSEDIFKCFLIVGTAVDRNKNRGVLNYGIMIPQLHPVLAQAVIVAARINVVDDLNTIMISI